MKKVSCLMRCREYWGIYTEKAIKNFIDQDYPNKELVIVDQGAKGFNNLHKINLKNATYIYEPIDESKLHLENREDWRKRVGFYRKLACKAATGDYVINWDDDDIHEPNRISESVKALELGFNCCYLPFFYVLMDGKYYPYESTAKGYKLEASMIFERDALMELYDKDGWWNMQTLLPHLHVGAIDNPNIFIYRIHDKNRSTKREMINKLFKRGTVPMRLDHGKVR